MRPDLLIALLTSLVVSAARAEPEAVVVGEGEYRSQPVSSQGYDEHYTIQIGAFSSHEQAAQFAQGLSLPAEQMGIARILVNENLLYVLAYGMYSGKDEALQAAEEICGQEGLDGCWARSLGGVRELSKAAQERDEQDGQ